MRSKLLELYSGGRGFRYISEAGELPIPSEEALNNFWKNLQNIQEIKPRWAMTESHRHGNQRPNHTIVFDFAFMGNMLTGRIKEGCSLYDWREVSSKQAPADLENRVVIEVSEEISPRKEDERFYRLSSVANAFLIHCLNTYKLSPTYLEMVNNSIVDLYANSNNVIQR